MPAPRIINFGCRLNAYEGEVMRGLAGDDPDLVVVNTCAVTAEAERQARQQVRKIKREQPGARIVVTGCAAQLHPERWAAMPEVARVLGNAEKLMPHQFDARANDRVAAGDIQLVRETAEHLLDGFAERARAFVEIQQGCDHRCTFCIIPFARGPSRSVPVGQVVARIQRLVDAGFKEVVLTGVDITSYGGELPGTVRLGTLVQRILKLVPDLARLRLSSIDSIEADDALMDALASEARFMPHLHLSLQHGDDVILKRMKRRHSREDALRFCADVRARRPGIALGADIIAGFPTESDAAFENSLSLIDDCGLSFLHVFPYSERDGTPAARMPQLPVTLRKERAARLRAAGDAALARYLHARIGSSAQVLIENEDGHGHDADFAPVQVEGAHLPGSIVTARIAASDGRKLTAQ